MGYKSIDGLMRHLRNNGINVAGSKQKRQLRNTGYYHGYKGYRFFYDSSNRIPFSSYHDVYATIQYDSALKSLLYSKVMFIETAVKSVAIESILKYSKSETIHAMCEKAITSYINSPSTFNIDQKKKAQENKLSLEKSIYSGLHNAYKKENPVVSHFYNNAGYSEVPIWALFEILTMGDFGHLLSCLNFDVRNDISKTLRFNLSVDTDRQLIYKYIFTIKDLRNAIAHNSVVYDTRFRKMDSSRAMKRCLELEVGLPYVNFKTIGDYIVLISFFLKHLGVAKTEIRNFIKEFEKITNTYLRHVDPSVSNLVIHRDLFSRISILKRYV